MAFTSKQETKSERQPLLSKLPTGRRPNEDPGKHATKTQFRRYLACAFLILVGGILLLRKPGLGIRCTRKMQAQSQSSDISWKVDPFNPPSIPLAVRSVYVSTWLEGGNKARKGLLNSQFASAFNGNFLPWAVGVLVDGIAYTVVSIPGQACMEGPPAKQISMTVGHPDTVTSVSRATNGSPVYCKPYHF